jgi:DNA polymerase-1
MGADFASLEDRISALTTKDPNKLKVYTDGYDGHCLRAYAYFKDEMPDIVLTVESINSIAKKYPDIRQRSKAPTFLLTYGGTYHGLIHNVGLAEDEAKAIEANYHEMYKVSDAWVKAKIDKASKDGYVTTAFGLRVRTPTLKMSLMNTRITPYEAEAEARTAGNALGQSYGLLNNRAGIDLQQRLLQSEYRYDVLPVAHIHDAQYFLVRDDIDVISYLNKNLVECMEWQRLPEIAHPDVGLGGELSVFHPTWETEYSLPNNGTESALRNAVNPPELDAA